MSIPQQDFQNFDNPYQNTGFDAEIMMPPRRSRGGCCFCGCCSGCLLLILLFVLGCVAFWYCCLSGGAPLIVSPETTVITEPLKSDGKSVDFYQAIKEMVEPEMQQLDDNGFVDVVRFYSHMPFGYEQQYLLMCKELGLDQPPPWDTQIGIPHDEGLDVLHVAAAKPHYFVPMVWEDDRELAALSQPFSVYAFHETQSKALRERAKDRYESGDIAGAWKDDLTSLRLFRHVTINLAWLQIGKNMDAGPQRQGLEMDITLLAPVTETAATLSTWTPEQLTQGIEDLESLPEWQDRKTTLQVMQFFLLDMVSATNDFPNLMRQLNHNVGHKEMPEGCSLEMMGTFLQVVGFDMNLLAKELNGAVKTYEGQIDKAADRSLDEQFGLLNLRQKSDFTQHFYESRWQASLEDKIRKGVNPLFTQGRSEFFGCLAGEMVAAAAGEMYRLQLMEETQCQTLRLAFALERYRREHQKYPDSLDELGLKAMPMDMSLTYEKSGEGYRIQNSVFRFEKPE